MGAAWRRNDWCLNPRVAEFCIRKAGDAAAFEKRGRSSLLWLWLSGRAERRRGGKEDYFFLSLFLLSFAFFLIPSPLLSSWYSLSLLLLLSLSLTLFDPFTTILLLLIQQHFFGSFFNSSSLYQPLLLAYFLLFTTLFFETTYISCPLLQTRKHS